MRPQSVSVWPGKGAVRLASGAARLLVGAVVGDGFVVVPHAVTSNRPASKAVERIGNGRRMGAIVACMVRDPALVART